jgi:syntaxin 7
VKADATTEEVEAVSDAVGAMTLTSQQIFSLGQTTDPLRTLEKLKERRKAVMDIEKGIYSLHQLSIELQTIIVEQGQIIDDLESFMDQTVSYTDQAEGRMKDAVESQKNIRRLRCSIV